VQDFLHNVHIFISGIMSLQEQCLCSLHRMNTCIMFAYPCSNSDTTCCISVKFGGG
jgi:hypothetical protein